MMRADCTDLCTCVCMRERERERERESVVFASGRCDVRIKDRADVQLGCTCEANWITNCMKTHLIG